MTEPKTSRHSPMRVAIIALAVAVVATAVLVAFLVWGRDAPTALPAPTPSPSSSPSRLAPSPVPSDNPSPMASAPVSAGPESPTPAPATSAPPVTAPVSTAATPGPSKASPATAQTMMWEGRATFEHFTVEVLQDDADPDASMIEDKAGLLVEVCVTKGTDGTDGAPISSEPWTLQDSDGNVQVPQQGGYEPAFPEETRLPVGKCARGFLTFDYVSVESDFANLVYENDLGDRAVWQFH